jgi:arylformamidase
MRTTFAFTRQSVARQTGSMGNSGLIKQWVRFRVSTKAWKSCRTTSQKHLPFPQVVKLVPKPMPLKMLSLALSTLLLFGLLIPALHATDEGWTEYANVQYGELHRGNKDASVNLVSLDVYVPNNLSPDEKLPLVVMFHGGEVGSGDKAHASVVENKIPFFTSNRFVFASANYELSPAVKYPVNVQDVADAIAFLYDNAETYQIDPANISIMGHSSGAHLVALVATDEKFFENAGVSPEIVSRVILLDGIYNLPERLRNDTKTNKEAIHAAFGYNPLTLYKASPALIVKKAPKTYTPQMLNFFTGNEAKILADIKFVELLNKNNIPAGGILCREFTHADVNWYVGLKGSEMNKPILDFLGGEDPRNLDGEIEKTPGDPPPGT